jgi:hypothetical protein
MARRSVTPEGFRAALRQPALPLAEVAWRWTFGTAVCVLSLLALLEFLDTLTVTDADLFLLRTRQPFLVSQAVTHILHGSGFRFVMAGVVLYTCLSAAWMLAASLGRAATVRWLIDYFRERYGTETHSEGVAPASLFGVHFLRVALTLAAAVSCVGAAMLAGFASSANDPQPMLVFLLFLPMLCLVWLTWSLLNWVLSVAAILVVRERTDTFTAVAGAVTLYRERQGAMLAVGFWFGLAHLVAFVLATSLVAFPLGFVTVLPAGVVLGGVLAVTLIYFALADWLYVGRLAAYVSILEQPEETVIDLPLPVEPVVQAGEQPPGLSALGSGP